jgi:RNA polymerase sigma-70 factor (ECF subfamily)
MSYSSKETIPSMSDSELIARYKSSLDKQMIGELYKRYTHLVLGMCLHYFRDRDIAKDMTIQIFEKLFEELKKREVENFRAWLSFVVRNHCISELRKMQTRMQRSREYEMELRSGMVEEDESTDAKTESRILQLESALSHLNPLQKKCIELFYYQNKSYSEIVMCTGFSANEVKSYIQNGKRNLKLLLSEKTSLNQKI